MPVLELVGLDADADTTYAVVLSGHPHTPEHPSAATCLPPSRVQTALRALQAHNLIRRQPGRPARYAALDPGIVLDLLLLQR